MAYKIFYIEDLDPESRIETLKDDNFNIISTKPNANIDAIVDQIKVENPDIIVMDYKLTEGSDLCYCDAPTIASTLRSQYNYGMKEMPIILMSTNDIKINEYKKDYTSHDLFDYAISKERALENPTYFRQKCLSFLNAYKVIKERQFKVEEILALPSDIGLLNTKLSIQLKKDTTLAYEYSRFIFEHIIRCSGLLIGEDILSARLGIGKSSSDWNRLKSQLIGCKYTGIFSDVYDRWWMDKINIWCTNILGVNHSLRQYEASERVVLIKEKTSLTNLEKVVSSQMNLSKNYWSICKETLLPLDPFDGIELLDEEVKPWQDKEYVSIEGALNNLPKYMKIISESDKKMLREYQ